jgi:hypothetical protein
LTKKPSKSKMTDQTALSYGFGETTLGKILVATRDKGVVFILIDGSNAKLLTPQSMTGPRNTKESSRKSRKTVFLGSHNTNFELPETIKLDKSWRQFEDRLYRANMLANDVACSCLNAKSRVPRVKYLPPVCH